METTSIVAKTGEKGKPMQPGVVSRKLQNAMAYPGTGVPLLLQFAVYDRLFSMKMCRINRPLMETGLIERSDPVHRIAPQQV